MSPLFSSKGKLSPNLMRSLIMRGGGLMINDCLQRFGWLEMDPVLTTMVATDLDFGMIRGVRFETRGTGPNVKFSAAELWETTEDVAVTIKISNLSKLTWVREGDCRNQTYWMDSSDFEGKAQTETETNSAT